MTQMEEQKDGAPAPQDPVLKISRGLTDWFKTQNCSIALTTYQSGVLFLVGRDVDGSPRAQGRQIERCQGLLADGQTVLASGRNTLWRFENALDDG